MKHRAEKPKVAASRYRIEGSVASDEELAAAVAFCKQHGASLERN
jgi:threonine aldolase